MGLTGLEARARAYPPTSVLICGSCLATKSQLGCFNGFVKFAEGSGLYIFLGACVSSPISVWLIFGKGKFEPKCLDPSLVGLPVSQLLE